MSRQRERITRTGRLAAVLCAALTLACALLSPPACADPAVRSREILILYHEAGFAAPSNRALFTGMHAFFAANSGSKVIMYTETLDLSLFQGEGEEQALVDFYQRKYAFEHIDALVPVQGPALDFLLKHRDTLFPGVPIVYTAPVEITPAPEKRADLTGIALAVDIRGTVDLARTIHPGLKRLALAGGTGKTDQAIARLARSTLKEGIQGLEIIDLVGLPMDEILNRVRSLPESTAILYLPVFMDGTGRRFVPTEALKAVSSAANAPVYCVYDSDLGNGCVGGSMASYEALGARAAGLVLQVMGGETPGSIRPEVMGSAVPMFDWRQLKRWKIPEEALPTGSVVQYRELTFWERDKWFIIGIALSTVAQLTLIAFLLLAIRTRKRIEDELRESEFRYRTVSDFTYDWEYWIGPDGNFIYTSSSCERVTGYSSEDFSSDPGLRRRIIVPEDQGLWEEHLREESEMIELRSIQFRIRTKDGQVRWIDHACVPVRDDSGRFLGYRASNRDITERKRAEEYLDLSRRDLEEEIARRRIAQEALASSEADLKRAQEVALIGSWQLDIAGDVLTWSEGVYDIFGLPRGAPLSFETFLDTIHPDDRELVIRSWDRALHGELYDLEHRIIVNGAVKWVREKAEVDFSPEGEPLRGTGIVQDITMRKLAEEEYHKLFQSLVHVSRISTVGELTATLAHEINQPLAAILANAQAARHMVDADEPDLAELRETIDDIISDDKRAREVVQRIRAIMKKEGGVFENMDIAGVVREACKLVEKESLIRDIRLRIEHSPDTPAVTADRIQLQQVLINLIINAMESMTDNGASRSITVRSFRSDSGNAVVSVEDTGKGISQEDAQLLFEPFYTTKQGGLGLGLSISRSIIEAHGGKLLALPNPGGGAVFFFTIPAAKGNA
ncbi:MAG TPA: ABC transporter substrate binding protein [Deltaproteobacteria bacterium]|nr:ABC transporter substrate binding protein [Deltaproteobacteria bacterium]HOI06674.1 ABC transporter substrate binding protein [Deltaproteobacteria bacterium]